MTPLYKISGGSGCTIEVFPGHVRKISPSIEYNHRLLAQMNKQKSWTMYKVPEVFGTGIIRTLAYMDMERISGKRFSRSIFDYSLNTAFDTLCSIIPPAESVVLCNVTDIVIEKVESIVSKTQSKAVITLAERILDADWTQFPTGISHGDLTLENILDTKDGPVVIDFLDTAINSFIIDIAKLLQDTELFWSYRFDGIPDPMLLKALSALLRRQVMGYSELLDQILWFNTLRILPYIKDGTTETWLIGTLRLWGIG